MLNDDDKIIVQLLKKMMDVRCGRNKQLSYMKKENTQGKVLETTTTVLGICCYPF